MNADTLYLGTGIIVDVLFGVNGKLGTTPFVLNFAQLLASPPGVLLASSSVQKSSRMLPQMGKEEGGTTSSMRRWSEGKSARAAITSLNDSAQEAEHVNPIGAAR